MTTHPNITGPEVVANADADALADKFTKHVYANGEIDVFGERVSVMVDGGVVVADILPTQTVTHQTVRMSRAHAIELRDALDVLLRATSKAVAE
jgi:hypothetical protein